MMSLSDFIKQYQGQTGVGNTDANKGQCVGLVSVWQDNLNTPHEYGNAKDLLNNANTTLFDIIPNSPTDFPVAGDVIVWGDTWGGGFGHTAICVTANANSFTSFEQNDITSQDLNGACEVLSHQDYSGVLGWLHLKAGYPQTSPDPQQGVLPANYDDIVRKATLYDQFNAAGYTNIDSVKNLLDTLTQARDNNQTSYEKEVETNKGLSDQVATLTTQNTSLKANVSAVQKQNADLQQQLADLNKSDATAIDLGIEAEQKLQSQTNEINKLASAMDTTYPPITNLIATYQNLAKQHQDQINLNTKQANSFQAFFLSFFKRK